MSLAIIALGCGCARRKPSLAEEAKRGLERTPARLERGRYLVEGPAHCFGCHSEVDYNAALVPKPGKKGGGFIFPPEESLIPLPYQVVASNISPDPETGAGKWNDEDFVRALRQGIGQDGRTLFPLMPYMFFRTLSDEDLASIIVYVRSVEPVRISRPKTTLPEPVKQALKPLDPITAPVPPPDLSDPVKRGAYLVNAGLCEGCHTPSDQQFQPIAGLRFGGGFRLVGEWGDVAAANLTPDPSGIPYYDEALFIQVLRTGKVKARELKPIMPWGYFKNMTDQDLKAIFAFLRTLKPVSHRVDNTEPPFDCKRCGWRHGLGNMN